MANTLKSSLASQQLVLRNFSGEETVRAAWADTGLVLEPPQWREFGIFKVDAIKLKGQMLTLRCTRHGVVREKTEQIALYGQPTKVNIEVDLRSADPKQALASVRQALFFASIDDALAAIPKPVQESIPFRIDNPWPSRSAQATKACDCADSGKAACKVEASKDAQVQPPKLLRGADPHFSDDARRAKLNGNVIVSLVVDKAGDPTDVWVMRPVGLGLDEAAAKAVLTYVFQPATCHGNPVSVYLNVGVNFQID